MGDKVVPDWRLLPAAALLAIVPVASSGTWAAEHRAAAEDGATVAVRAVLDDYVRSGKVAGIVVAIGRDDAAPVFLSAGHISYDAGAPAAGPDSLWRIYSMTKPVTAMAVMMLVEQGKLRLDENLADVIPAFRNVRVAIAPDKSLDSRPAAHPITIRELLTHSSGLTYQIIGTGPLPQEYKRLGLLGGRAAGEAGNAQPASLAAFADRLAGVPLIAEPGTAWNYSVGLDVLGRVVEVVSGEPFDRFVQKHILDPAGMTSTYWTVPAAQTARMSTAYSWAGSQHFPIDTGRETNWLQPPKAPYGGSGLVSSARDYDRFLHMLAAGGSIGGRQVLKPETVALATSNLLPAGVHITNDVAPAPVTAEGFGAGGSVYLSDVPGGVGAGTYGWFGAAGTIAFLDKKSGLRVTVMVNYFPGKKWPLYADVVRAIYSARAK